MPPPSPSPAGVPTSHAVLAGVVCALVGFTSSFAVVLTGLRAVGADPREAGSGLLVLCVTMGVGCLFFSWRTRMPVTMAWSTPGAALLTTAVTPAAGFGAAVTAFAVSGVLLTAAGAFRPLLRLVERIPVPLASAMLAGVLLSLCTQPFRALAHSPAAIAPVVLTWLLLMAVRRRWAVLGALAAAVVVLVVEGTFAHVRAADLVPHLALVHPRWDLGTVVAIGLPLFVVTMTSQNIPGIAVLGSFGYRPDMRPPLAYAGAASVAGSVAGAHAINLAAISAALAAGPEAHPDRDRRWVAGASAGISYLALGPASAAVAAVAAAAPTGLVETIAGLALLATLAAAVTSAVAETGTREAAVVTLVVAASGISVAGVGAAFWGLVAGAAYLLVTRRRLS